MLLYLFILCVPGVGIACKKKGFFDENDYVVVLAEKEEHEWKCTDDNVKGIKGMEVEEDFGSVSITLLDEKDITCKEGLKDCCKCRDWFSTCCNSCCQKGHNSEDMETTEDEKAIMFIYFGEKKNFTTAIWLQMSDGQRGNYPPKSNFYVIPKNPDHSLTFENPSATQDQEPPTPDPPKIQNIGK